MIAFTRFLEAVFGTSSYEVLPNIEKYISSSVSMVKLKGRMDLHFGRTIIEFKTDLPRERTCQYPPKAYEQVLRRHGIKDRGDREASFLSVLCHIIRIAPHLALFSPSTSPDVNALFDGDHKDLPVARLPRPCRSDYRIYDLVHLTVVGNDLDLCLG